MTADPTTGIVVLGTPRSGTTLLRRLLDAHPRISCPGETNLLAGCGRFLRTERTMTGIELGVPSGLAFGGIPEERILESLRNLFIGFHREMADRAGKPRWAEKSAFDSFYLDAIERMLAGHVRFLVLNRHGLDFAMSMDDLCRENGMYPAEVHRYVAEHPMPLESFARCWADVTGALLDFASRHAEDAMVIRYEELASAPEAVMGRVFGFLGEECPGDLVTRALGSRGALGLGDWKTYGRSKVDDSSVGRGRGLPEYLRSRLAPILNPTLVRAGYDEMPAGAGPTAEEARRSYELGLLLGGLRPKPPSRPG